MNFLFQKTITPPRFPDLEFWLSEFLRLAKNGPTRKLNENNLTLVEQRDEK